ncbi:PIN domain-containing protein [Oharaeibacter diazotrophicus]|uniref:Putative nucleic acid-binding protein n=1 Tax=Oharaeibacter diazotrophicus TaxID=1920512 RepID=A0A4R6R9G8_9HYPH|nr:PIN domain-containing protein [Oharaeibacter diazotrophicus]TDP82711.1 putative nucleic acid-binding protein [Oharaeibacter diazotrophicus]BBE72527.1 tRNA(fMet)-specific endonuclease VapC [Pleomorphomonas sp. SM30]GLS76557.1 twitching motility protein PilT [Oharaeibacter diazotrophicus]
MLPTIDSNILVYAIDRRDTAKADVARLVVARVRETGGLLGLQTIGETFRVATAKLKWHPAIAERYLQGLLATFPTFAQTSGTVSAALALAAAGRLSIWDANLVSAAQSAGCTHLLSEDMQDGDRFGGLEVVDPFAGRDLSPRARDLLSL